MCSPSSTTATTTPRPVMFRDHTSWTLMSCPISRSLTYSIGQWFRPYKNFMLNSQPTRCHCAWNFGSLKPRLVLISGSWREAHLTEGCFSSSRSMSSASFTSLTRLNSSLSEDLGSSAKVGFSNLNMVLKPSCGPLFIRRSSAARLSAFFTSWS